jgi:hypothetical protein
MLGEIGRAIERYAEASSTDVVGDDPVFQLGRLHSSYTLLGRPIGSEIIERLSLSSLPSNCNLGRARFAGLSAPFRRASGFICAVPACKENRR